MSVVDVHSVVKDVADALQVCHVHRVLLQYEGAEGRVQQVVVQLVETHAADVLQQLLDHDAPAHRCVLRSKQKTIRIASKNSLWNSLAIMKIVFFLTCLGT